MMSIRTNYEHGQRLDLWRVKNGNAAKQRLKKLKLSESVALTEENRNLIGYNYLEYLTNK